MQPRTAVRPGLKFPRVGTYAKVPAPSCPHRVAGGKRGLKLFDAPYFFPAGFVGAVGVPPEPDVLAPGAGAG